MIKSTPVGSHRKGLSLAQLTRKFSTEDKAERWFVNRRWQNGVRCVRCDSDNVQDRPTRKPQLYRCSDCHKDFSVKTDTVLHNPKIPLSSWAIAFYTLLHEPQERVQHEAAPRSRNHPDIGMALGTPDPGGLWWRYSMKPPTEITQIEVYFVLSCGTSARFTVTDGAYLTCSDAQLYWQTKP